MAFFAGIKSLGARLGAHGGSHEHGMSTCAMSLRMILGSKAAAFKALHPVVVTYP